MAQDTKIQWTDVTWNIARGCTKVDEDCKYCYMYRESLGGTRYEPKTVVKTKSVFNLPLKIEPPMKIFTSSLTDVFHEDCDEFRGEMWDIIRKCPQHTFQILTKRPERIKDHLPEDWGDGWKNVWLGVSIGSQTAIERVAKLADIPAFKRFVSAEPLWDRLSLDEYFREEGDGVYSTYLDWVDWVIVGGESGNETGKFRYRPCEFEWIELIVSQCKSKNVPVFVKQMGTYLSRRMCMSDRNGGNIDDFPEHLRIRQFPET